MLERMARPPTACVAGDKLSWPLARPGQQRIISEPLLVMNLHVHRQHISDWQMVGTKGDFLRSLVPFARASERRLADHNWDWNAGPVGALF